MPTTRITGQALPQTTTRTTVMSLFRSSHLVAEHVGLEEVMAAYLDCRRKKRTKASAMRYELNYEMENCKLCEELNAETYEIGVSNTFCVTLPKLREIFAADFRDRIVHHLIANRILSTVEAHLSDEAYACRKGMGSLYGAKRIYDKMMVHPDGWVMKCDIRGFFMSIDKEILWGIIEPIIKEAIPEDTEWWKRLIRKVVFHRPEQRCERHGDVGLWNKLPPNKSLFHSEGRGLPIGNLTSQILANLYMSPFDRWIENKVGSDRYGRYVDDFVLIGENSHELTSLLVEIRQWLRDNLKMELHPNKVYIQPIRRGLSFVGYISKGERLYCESRTIYNANSVVDTWNREDSHTREQRERFISRMNSYFGLLRNGKTYKVRHRLLERIKDKEGLMFVNNKKIRLCKTG